MKTMKIQIEIPDGDYCIDSTGDFICPLLDNECIPYCNAFKQRLSSNIAWVPSKCSKCLKSKKEPT